jgi:hypothetical protein
MPHDVTPAYLAECLAYDAETGALTWLARPREHFKTEAAYKYGLVRAGTRAGGMDKSTGYMVVGLLNRLYYAHRICWALAHGEWPDVIDHANGDKTDNRAANLRSVSHAENTRNVPLTKANKSGIKGVSFVTREGKWRARIMVDYRDIHCGYWDTMEEAVAARQRALAEHGFHPNHGAEHGIVWTHERSAA